MAKLNRWMCDICCKIYDEGDFDYSNQYPLKLEICLGGIDGIQKIEYEDVCHDCRDKVYWAIDKTIADCIK